MNFGQKIKELRISARISLREFSRQITMDPSNWSKIERSILPLPADPELLTKFKDIFSLSPRETQELSDLADLSRGQLPQDLQNEELLAKMPAFFRAIRGQEYTQEDLDQMSKEVRKLNSGE